MKALCSNAVWTCKMKKKDKPMTIHCYFQPDFLDRIILKLCIYKGLCVIQNQLMREQRVIFQSLMLFPTYITITEMFLRKIHLEGSINPIDSSAKYTCSCEA